MNLDKVLHLFSNFRILIPFNINTFFVSHLVSGTLTILMVFHLTVLGHGNNRSIMQGRSYFFRSHLGGQRYNPIQDFKMKNGAIVLARNFNYDNHALKSHSFSRPSYQAKNIFSRYNITNFTYIYCFGTLNLITTNLS